MTVRVTEADFTLTRDEVAQIIDSTARAERDMSGAQLLRAFREGALENPGDVGEILILADLLPDDDPLVTGAGED